MWYTVQLYYTWTAEHPHTTHSAPGPDLVTNELVARLCDAGRQKPLELANNMSWACEELLSIWRKGIIMPIFKKGVTRPSLTRLPSMARPSQ